MELINIRSKFKDSNGNVYVVIEISMGKGTHFHEVLNVQTNTTFERTEEQLQQAIRNKIITKIIAVIGAVAAVAYTVQLPFVTLYCIRQYLCCPAPLYLF